MAAGAAIALRRPVVGLALAAAAFAAGSAAVIHLDPAPRIDVWYSLQGAADAVLHGRDMYTQVWPSSPGVKDAFTYLPWTGVLLAPAKLLTGDVRWGLAVAELGLAAVIVAFGRGRGPDRAGSGVVPAAVLLLLPGTFTQIEQAWTEPLIALLLAGALLAVDGGRLRLAVVLVALALASKQHIVLLLPLLAVWRPVGPRRTAAVAAGGALLVLPWAVWDLPAMWHDTVTLLVGFHVIQFSDTLYLAAVHELGWTPPFWLAATLILAVIALAVGVVRRFSRSGALRGGGGVRPLRREPAEQAGVLQPVLAGRGARAAGVDGGSAAARRWRRRDQAGDDDRGRRRSARSDASHSSRIALTCSGASSAG